MQGRRLSDGRHDARFHAGRTGDTRGGRCRIRRLRLQNQAIETLKRGKCSASICVICGRNYAKVWPDIRNRGQYAGKEAFFCSVTDPYQPHEAKFQRTRKVLEQLQGTGIRLSISTKSDLILRDLDAQVRRFCSANGLTYVRNDDTVRARHGEPPVVVNYFYHEEIVPSARKEQLRKTRTCC